MLSSPALTDGVPDLPGRRILVLILLMSGFWFCAARARGQNAAPESPPVVGPDAGTGALGTPASAPELAHTARELKALTQAQAQAKAAAGPEIDRLKAQLELQQKQIDVLLRMTNLLADQLKKQAPVVGDVEKLEEQVATQAAQLQQGAQRDLEQAEAHDQLVEQIDALTRSDSWLPGNLKELFSPYRNNQSPLTIYGTVAEEFNAFSKLPSTFRDQSLGLRPYLLLNERWLMSANVALQQGTVQFWRAQAEWFVNDNLTVVFGRFYSPIGFFSERLRIEWVIKTPDPPLMFNQVYPAQLSFNGIQLRGSRYVADTPLKLEYAGFVSNGLTIPGSKLAPAVYSNLNNFSDLNDINSVKAFGGRLGMSIPKVGFIAGLSGLANQAYDTAGNTLNLWDVDASWHRGNWDARFELAKTDQQTPQQPIHRFGFYTQVAYRQYDNPHRFLQKLEYVFRFDHVEFDGINLKETGINFGGLGLSYARQPLDRNRFTYGINYWFYPSLVLKLAIEINNELGVPSLRDNGFLGQLVWGF
jgi:hypothetical protein